MPDFLNSTADLPSQRPSLNSCPALLYLNKFHLKPVPAENGNSAGHMVSKSSYAASFSLSRIK